MDRIHGMYAIPIFWSMIFGCRTSIPAIKMGEGIAGALAGVFGPCKIVWSNDPPNLGLIFFCWTPLLDFASEIQSEMQHGMFNIILQLDIMDIVFSVHFIATDGTLWLSLIHWGRKRCRKVHVLLRIRFRRVRQAYPWTHCERLFGFVGDAWHLHHCLGATLHHIGPGERNMGLWRSVCHLKKCVTGRRLQIWYIALYRNFQLNFAN